MIEILAPDRLSPVVREGVSRLFVVHDLPAAAERAPFLAEVGPRVRGLVRGGHASVDRALIERLPALEIVASFGVGYDGIDVAAAAERGVIVTNTPDVLTEEVADTALGLLLMTVRELSAAERHLRAGRWASSGPYPLSPSLRDRTVGIVGLGRIGMAIARRLDAMRVPVVYHARRAVAGVPYRYYDDLRAMASGVGVLLVIVPGGAATRNMIDRSVLEALGPNGILISVGRGSSVDEPALIEALRNRAHPRRRPGRLCERAERSGGAPGIAERRAAAARRVGVGLHAQRDGAARGRQPEELVRGRQAAHTCR